MKVALAYDYLNQLGGGERVLRVLCDMFPQAPIYTILYDPIKTGQLFADRKIVTSFLDFSAVHRYHRWFIPLMPLAAQSISLRHQYDLIISAGASYGKGISYDALRTRHIHYCYTPLRYAWEPDFLELRIKNYELRKAVKPLLYLLRNWDYKMAQKPDVILADSKYIAAKIEKYYGRRAQVLYPPLDGKRFFFDPKIKKGDYFLAVGRLVHYKRFDLIVEAFNRLKWPLKIAGSGPEKNNLKKTFRSSQIEMVDYVSDDNLRQLYAGARSLIFPQEEDFGLTAVEAQACGTPVIALGRGGALETVVEGETGIFFKDQSVDGLVGALIRFNEEEKKFNSQDIAKWANRFSLQSFKNVLESSILSCQSI